MDKIEELLTRAVANIIPSREELEKKLRSGKKIRVYQGFDPTSPQFHIGHLVGLRKLRQWQDLGHEVIFLIGDFTGMIGDPTGKDTARIPLTQEQTRKNAKTYKEQASKILKFDGENPVKIKYNSEWFAKMSAAQLIELTSYLTIQQVVERDMFQKRMKNNMNIAMSEFLYPFMQGYDSVAMDVDVEIGGSDQLFNMMTGRDLMHKIKRKNKFVMTTPLLTDVAGNKIGKTEGNAIAITDEPGDLFGKIMTLPDDAIVKGLEYLTDIPINEIKKIEQKIKKGENPIQYKKLLAFEIVKQLNNEQSAKKAQEHFERVVQQRELIPVFEMQNIPTWPRPRTLISGPTIVEPLVKTNTVQSKSEVKRLVEQGGIAIITKGGEERQIADIDTPLPNEEVVIRVGKRKFVKIKSAS